MSWDVEAVAEFITDRQTGLLVPGLQADRVADAVLEVLGDPRLARRLRAAARKRAESTLDMARQLQAFDEVVADIT